MQIGDRAPEVLGLDENGQEVRLSQFSGQKIILYFYPKDNTSGCTFATATPTCSRRVLPLWEQAWTVLPRTRSSRQNMVCLSRSLRT